MLVNSPYHLFCGHVVCGTAGCTHCSFDVQHVKRQKKLRKYTPWVLSGTAGGVVSCEIHCIVEIHAAKVRVTSFSLEHLIVSHSSDVELNMFLPNFCPPRFEFFLSHVIISCLPSGLSNSLSLIPSLLSRRFLSSLMGFISSIPHLLAMSLSWAAFLHSSVLFALFSPLPPFSFFPCTFLLSLLLCL